VKLYRAMKVAADGLPEVGRTKRTLGVRPGDQAPNNDVHAVLPDDPVIPGTGGMLVAPNDPLNLPRYLRPREFGGTGKDPVWEIDDADLPPALVFRQDKATHGMIEPKDETTLAGYESALASTRDRWRLVPPPSAGGQP
jgi:hypothetical protein